MDKFLSDTELYFLSSFKDIPDPPKVGISVVISGDEFHHMVNVMRHKTGDEILLTDGHGLLFQTRISSIGKNSMNLELNSINEYKNPFSDLYFCIPRLRSADRFEYALEKCVELGITNFIVFDSVRTVAKGEKLSRWEKIVQSAMKQSLRTWLPTIIYKKSIAEICKSQCRRVLLDQNSDHHFTEWIKTNMGVNESVPAYLFFGPEGGFTSDEESIIGASLKVRLTGNRLRAETAVVLAASLLSVTLL